MPALDVRKQPHAFLVSVQIGALQQVISELDEKKREALEITWNKVNSDFGSIFSTLLPDTSAKLGPQEGHSFLDGALQTGVAHCPYRSDTADCDKT